MRPLKALLLIWLAILASSAPALAQRALSDEETALMLGLYLDTVLEDRQFLAACAKASGKAITGWDEGASLFVATLSASDLPEDVIRSAKTRIEAPVVGATCDDLMSPERQASIQSVGNWSEIHGRMLKDALGLKIVYSSGAITLADKAVGAIFQKHGPPQRIALRCSTVLGGPYLPIKLADWAKDLARAEALLGQSGLPGRLWRKKLDELRPAAILADLGDRKALLAACITDQSWQEHIALLRQNSFVPDLESALLPWIAATQQ
jgi:hypothetical protein